ncbi:MAG: hypothetical protein ABR543_04410 [Gemmatimonadaceae bacterium]
MSPSCWKPAVLAVFVPLVPLFAQQQNPAGVFDVDSVLPVTLTVNIKAIKKDRGSQRPYHRGSLTYDEAGSPTTLPVQVRTRGIYRLKNCSFPPLRLNFSKSRIKNTIFGKHDKPKLVTHCEESDDYEQYLLQEYAIYEVYNLLTPLSLRARLARVTYVDSATAQPATTRFGILLEEEASMAERNGGKVHAVQGARGDDLDPLQTAIFAVFQFMIGNTDWSVSALHNVQLVQAAAAVHPVAYDFDWTGVIGTRYAKPDPQLGMKSVKERVYRGYCVSPEMFSQVLQLFNEKKEAIYAVYRRIPSLNPQHLERTHKYFDEFYDIIGNARRAKSAMADQCRS